MSIFIISFLYIHPSTLWCLCVSTVFRLHKLFDVVSSSISLSFKMDPKVSKQRKLPTLTPNRVQFQYSSYHLKFFLQRISIIRPAVQLELRTSSRSSIRQRPMVSLGTLPIRFKRIKIGRRSHISVCKTYWKDLNVEDDEVKSEWQAHWSDQPHVCPWWHSNKWLIFWQATQRKTNSIINYYPKSINNSTNLFMAFNISMVTRTERAMVIGWGSEKTLQSTPLKSSPPPRHCIWWDNCQKVNCGPWSEYMNHQVAPPTVAAPT